MTGKIEVMFEVMCAECGQAEHPPARTKTDAAVVLLGMGWRKKKKGWTCWECIIAIETDNNLPK